MAGLNRQALNLRIMRIVLDAAKSLGRNQFNVTEVVDRVRQSLPNMPATTIRSYVLAMSQDQSQGGPYFSLLGEGYYLLLGDKDVPVPVEASSLQPVIPTIPVIQRQLAPAPVASEPTPAPVPVTPVPQPPIQAPPTQLKPEPTPQPQSQPQPQAQPTPKPQPAIPALSPKDAFLQKYSRYITAWTRQNTANLIAARRNYRWRGATVGQSLDQRNHLSRQIVMSRIRNNGGIDRQTLDAIMAWGFPNPLFPERDEDACLRVTREAFTLLDQGKPAEAMLKLMSIDGVGISRASKIIGLSDQNSLAIYDSHIGAALETLTNDGHKIIKSPPGLNRAGDLDCSPIDWAENYQKLLWVMEVIRNELNDAGYPFNISDVEMALTMMGN